MKTQTKHVHYHVHYHGLNKIPPSPEDILNHKLFPEPAEFHDESLEREDDTPTLFYHWVPKLSQPFSQNKIDLELEGEPVLWSGVPNPRVLRKRIYDSSIAFILSSSITCLFVMAPMRVEDVIFFWLTIGITLLCVDIWTFAVLIEANFHKQDYYEITPTRVIIFRGEQSNTIRLKDIEFWKVKFMKNNIGSLFLGDKNSAEYWFTLYKINKIAYVKHLVLFLHFKTSALKAETIPDFPRLTYCPQCGYNLRKEINSH